MLKSSPSPSSRLTQSPLDKLTGQSTKVVNQPNHQDRHLPFPRPTLWWAILGVSLSLHGVLLMMPIPAPSLTETESEELPQVKSGTPLQTIALADLLTSPPKPLPASPQLSESPAPITDISGLGSSEITSTPSPASPDLPVPSPPDPPLSPAIQELDETTQTSTVTASNPDTVQHFFDQLTETTGLPTTRPNYDLFPEPELYFENGETTELQPALHVDILNTVWIAGKTPEDVYISVLSSQLQSEHFQTVQKSNYGQGIVYEISQTNTVWYLNLVPTVNGEGTIIVVWKQDPSNSTIRR